MASVYKPPEIPIAFRGLDLSGNPIKRTSVTAAVCNNFRVMPGNWLRLRGGHQARVNTPNGLILQLHSFRDPNFPGSAQHLAQVKHVINNTVAWGWFDLSTYNLDPFNLIDISTAYDGGWALTKPAAVANITDRPVMYNGLGVRDGTNSRPALSTFYGGVIRYFGLDAYHPSGSPVASFAPGGGNNIFKGKVQFSVGLFHEPTGHFSNGIPAGSIGVEGADTGSGTATITGLQTLKAAYNNPIEQGELFYVVYATVENGGIFYLLLDQASNGPLKVPISSNSISISTMVPVFAQPNGYFLDTTSEMPQDNHPPRPMKCLASVNGKLYGLPLPGGSGGGLDFSYKWADRDRAAVAWSKAPGDDRETKGIGDATQSWPLTNVKPIPNIETPVWLCPSVGGTSLLVFTPRSTFLLTEVSTGLHSFTDISRIHGLGNPMSVRVTDYGIVWVDQRNQVCLLTGDSPEGFKVISNKYYRAISAKTVSCADYVLDPTNEIDIYKIWFTDNTTLIHDFRIREQDYPDGQAYTGSNEYATAAASMSTPEGQRHYVFANTGFYTYCGQPEDGRIRTTDLDFINPHDQTTVVNEINGLYRYNWNYITDWNERKQLSLILIVGDGRPSPSLSNNSPLIAKWWGDFDEVPGTPQELACESVNQTRENFQYRFTPTTSSRFTFKIQLELFGHSTDAPGYHYHANPSEQGDLAYNFYGCICSMGLLIGNEKMRPQ